jgi:hypothetical protein
VNEKTARLIRKFAEGTDAPEREIKRRWNEMSQQERFAFRQEMAAKVGESASIEEAE